MVTDQH